MAEGCGPRCAKILLIIANVIFLLCGAGLLGVGIWIRVDQSIFMLLQFANLNTGDPILEYATYIMMAAGAFIMIISFIGCCGAFRESKCFLGLYITFLLLILSAEIAAGVLAILKKDEIEQNLVTKGREILENDYMPVVDSMATTSVISRAVDVLQIELKCCGLTESGAAAGVSDYMNNRNRTQFKIPPMTVPFSCYRPKNNTQKAAHTLRYSDVDPTMKYQQNCRAAFIEWVNRHSIILIGISLGVAALQLFGFIFALCLCRNVGEEV